MLKQVIRLSLPLVFFIGLALVWKFTPLADKTDVFFTWLASLGEHPAGPLLMVLAFVVGGFLMLPANLMTMTCSFVFGLLPGFLIAMVGSMANAMVLYWLGRATASFWLGGKWGKKVESFHEQLGKGDFVAVLLLRLFPFSPFTLENLACGIVKVPVSRYVIATMLGLFPWLFYYCWFAQTLQSLADDPGLPQMVPIIVGLIVAVAAGAVLPYFMKQGKAEEPGA